MAHKCRSSQYSNMRPRYVLGRTIPEAAGIAAAAVVGYVAFQLTSHLTYGGQAGKMHLLAIFAAVALPLIVGFVFFMDNQEPYPRQVVGYLRRRTVTLVRRAPGQARARVRGTQAHPRPAHVAHGARTTPATVPPTDLTGRLMARLRRARPVTAAAPLEEV